MFPITDTQHAVLGALCALDNAFAKALRFCKGTVASLQAPQSFPWLILFEDLQGRGLTMCLKRWLRVESREIWALLRHAT